MKMFFTIILLLLFSSNIYPQQKKILALKKIDEIVIGISQLDSLPKAFTDNAVDLQIFINMIQEMMPGIRICNSEQCRTELLLVYNVFHDKHNIIYGSVGVDCRRWAVINETGYSGFFSVWNGLRAFLFSENNTRDIKNVIYKYVKEVLGDFSADYNNENQ